MAENDAATEGDIAGAISNLNGAVDTARAGVQADEAGAKAVIDAINALPDPAGLSDKDAVEAARNAFAGLAEAQKAVVVKWEEKKWIGLYPVL